LERGQKSARYNGLVIGIAITGISLNASVLVSTWLFPTEFAALSLGARVARTLVHATTFGLTLEAQKAALFGWKQLTWGDSFGGVAQDLVGKMIHHWLMWSFFEAAGALSQSLFFRSFSWAGE